MVWPSKVIRWLFYALVFLVPLIFLPNTSELFEFNKMVLTYALTALIVGTWAIDCILQKRFVFRRTMLDIPILVFLGSNLLSFLTSINQHVSWYGYYSRFNGGLASLLCYAALYWAIVTYFDRKSSLLLIRVSLFSAFLVTAYGILEHFGIDASKWVQDVQLRVFSTLGQPNWLAAYIVILIFIPIARILTSKKFSLVQYLLFIVLFSCLLFTKSRSGLLGFGISFLFFGGYFLYKQKSEKPKKVLSLGIWILVIMGALTLAFPNPIRDEFQRRLHINSGPPSSTIAATPAGGTALESGGTESGTIRKIVWTGAIRIWLDGPKNFLLGSGPETFAMAYYQHRPVEHNQTSEWELLYNKAHNEFLNYLSTTGLLGLLSYLVLLFYIGKVFFKGEKDLLTIALFSGFISIPVTNFWGFSVVIIQILMFLLPALAITLNIEPEKPNTPDVSKSQLFATFIPLFVICYLLFVISRYWLADVSYASGLHDQRAFTITQDPNYIVSSFQSFSSAYRLNTSEPAISADFGPVAAYFSLLLSEKDASAAAQIASLAESASAQATAENPYHPNYFKSESRTYIILATADPKYFNQAAEALTKAAKISPTDPRIPYNHALIELYLHNPQAAKDYFKQATDLKPDLGPSVQAELAKYASDSAKIGR